MGYFVSRNVDGKQSETDQTPNETNMNEPIGYSPRDGALLTELKKVLAKARAACTPEENRQYDEWRAKLISDFDSFESRRKK